ncbi:MAG: BON domain-containing protein [Pyrinomonadaceae bacterium]|nr:BON domain-containing protein [Pyrinomonadaceae bacterium]
MNRGLRLLSAAGLGAGLMYLFDPARGKRRRALVRDQMKHAAKVAGDVTGKTGRGVRNHLLGVFAEVGSLFRSRDVSDDVVKARVRAKLGRVVSHPSAIEVKAVDGLIVLSGPILASEEHPLLKSVAAIPGVKNIENLLELHDQGGEITVLQGGQPEEGPLKTNWSPPEEFADVMSHVHETRCNMFMR